MTEPASTPEAVARWHELHDKDREPRWVVGDDERRNAVIEGLHALADFLESRPEIPVGQHTIPFMAFAYGTMDQQKAQVEYASTLTSAPVTISDGSREVRLEFGPIRYQFCTTGGVDPAAAEPGDVLLPGDEVRITGRAADKLRGRLPLAGIITGITDDGYLVRLPGRGGIAVPAASLERAPQLGEVLTSRGPVTTLEIAENEVIAASARNRARYRLGLPESRADATDVLALTAAMSRICELPRERILHLLRRPADASADALVRFWDETPVRQSRAPVRAAAQDSLSTTRQPTRTPAPSKSRTRR